MINIHDISADQPVLIAGPTASGKTSLAIEIAEAQGGVILNADALQVYSGWRILTARPSDDELDRAPHQLYGHVDYADAYSVGHWLRDITPMLRGARPIIVGGTGLYFQALTQGLAEIPATPEDVRAAADARRLNGETDAMFAELDPDTQSRIDHLNPMRVQRAYEVLKTTGRGLAAWQDATPAPILPVEQCFPIVMDADRDWLNERIARRFHMMMDAGAVDEARAMLPDWDPARQSSRAIGAPEMIAHLSGEIDREAAIDSAIIASRQYAKRQRTWFRSKMSQWTPHILP